MTSVPAILALCGLLAAAFLFARISRYAGLPSAAAIVLVGIAANGMLPQELRIRLTPPVLALFLPALIFEGAWSIDAASLRRVAWPVIVLAVPGVLVTAAIVAAGALATGAMTVAASLALGAMLSATDPVAILALFRTLRIPLDLRTMVEGESIANDGVAVLLVQAATMFAAGGHDVSSLWFGALYAPVAGMLIGTLVAKLLDGPMRRVRYVWFGIAATLAVAYGSYELATLAGASGIFASAAGGIVLSKPARDTRGAAAIERCWDVLALIANSIVFLLVGLSIRFERLFAEPLLVVAVLAAVAIARALLAYGLMPLASNAARKRGWRHTVALAGIRGGLSLALALGLPYDFPGRPQLIDAVFAVVFFTLVLQSWPLAPLFARIRFAAEDVLSA